MNKLARVCSQLLCVCAVGGASEASGQTALAFDDPAAHGFSADLILGWQFTANTNMTVTSLGYYDAFQDGFFNDHEVGIFRVSDQQLLAATDVTTDDPLEGFFRYAEVNPLNLIEGETYFIAGLMQGVIVGKPAVDSLNWANEISFEGWAIDDSDTLEFPNSYSPTFDPWAASDGYLINANFRYVVPAPGTALVGLAGFALLRRSRSV